MSLNSTASETMTKELGARIKRLRRWAVIMLLFIDAVLMPVTLFYVRFLTLRVSGKAYIPVTIAFLLLTVGVIILIHVLTSPLIRFNEWMQVQSKGKADLEQLRVFWNRLTRVPIQTGVGAAITVIIAGELIVSIYTFIGYVYLFQLWTASLIIWWAGGLVGLSLYLLLRFFLEPFYASMALEYMLEWGGRKFGIMAKIMGIVLVLGFLPMAFLNLIGYRNAQFGLRDYVMDQAKLRVTKAVEIAEEGKVNAQEKQLWSDAPEEWFRIKPDGSMQGNAVELPSLPNNLNETPVILRTKDSNLVWVAARSPTGHIVGNKLQLSLNYPQMKRLRRIMLIPTVLMLFVYIALAYLLGHSISRPIREMRNLSDGLCEKGSLVDTYLGGISDDEVGELAMAFNRLLDHIRKQYQFTSSLLDEMRGSVVVLGSSGEEMMRISERQTQNVEDQVKFIQEISSTSSHFSESAEDINKKAKVVLEASENTMYTCGEDRDSLIKVIADIGKSREEVSLLRARMDELNNASLEISDFINDINAIADKTELLALNASLEAVGAGKTGKRFSVVAKEVKRLAAISKEAAQKISRRTLNIQNHLNQTAEAASLTAERVLKAMDIIQEFQKSLERHSNLAQQTTRLANEIVYSTDQQSREAGYIVQAMEAAEDLCRQVFSGAKETEKAIDELGRLAIQLRKMAG